MLSTWKWATDWRSRRKSASLRTRSLFKEGHVRLLPFIYRPMKKIDREIDRTTHSFVKLSNFTIIESLYLHSHDSFTRNIEMEIFLIPLRKVKKFVSNLFAQLYLYIDFVQASREVDTTDFYVSGIHSKRGNDKRWYGVRVQFRKFLSLKLARCPMWISKFDSLDSK